MRRRELALAAAAAALARPAAAVASEGDVLHRLVEREEAAAFAYEAGGWELLARHAVDHARALRTQVDALGRRGPPPPRAASALDHAARRVAGEGGVAAAIALERSLLAEYEGALRSLSEPSILRTAATIAASHAQHHALMRRDSGLDPLG